MTQLFLKLVNNRLKFRLFLFTKLPNAFFSGVKVTYADEERCTATVPYKWLSQNPFKSTYFACLSMAAEMSTGILAMAHVYKRTPNVSMLVTKVESNFFKKAVGKTTFICTDGLAIKKVIEESIATGQGKTIVTKSVGTNAANQVVAEFEITWSFKGKNKII
jgi:Domain of unknown function (DUF4442)